MYTTSRCLFHVLLVLCTLALTGPTPTAAQRGLIYVDADASGVNNGASWADAYTNLQSALAMAQNGDEIWVAEGVYYPGPYVTSTFVLTNGVALYGGFAGIETLRTQRDWTTQVTVLSGDVDGNDLTDPHGVVTTTSGITGTNAYHVVTSSGVTGTAILDGVAITAGWAADKYYPNDCGGGMNNMNGSPYLTHLTFSGNRAFEGAGMCNRNSSSPTLTDIIFSGNWAAIVGGGMYNEGYNSSPTLTNVIFSDNWGSLGGGGMYNEGSSAPVLEHVTFSDNQANDGGGMYNNFGYPTLTDVTFEGNQAEYYGGGMFSDSSSPTLTYVTFESNQAGGYGGGMYNEDYSNPMLTHVTFSGNRAFEGGGVYNSWYGSPRLTNVVFGGNSATQAGGGMYSADKSSPTLINAIFSGNWGGDQGGGMYNTRASAPALTNVTFSGNQADEGGGIYNSDNSTTLLVNSVVWGNSSSLVANNNSALTVTYSLVEGGCPFGAVCDAHLLTANPLFVEPSTVTAAPTTTGDYRLQAASPAIDAGNHLSVTVSTDLDGNPRIVGSAVDLGAYETPYLLLHMSKLGTGGGVVTSAPIGVACGLTCIYGFSANTVVTLTAVPLTASIFAGWGGELITTTNPLVLTMDAAKQITATFNNIHAIFLPLIRRS